MAFSIGTDFVLGFTQYVTIAFGVMLSLISLFTYFFITERYAEALFGTVFTGAIIPLVGGLTLMPSKDVPAFLEIYGVIFFIPYMAANISLVFISDSEWVVRHTYGFYGWLVGTTVFVLSSTYTTYLLPSKLLAAGVSPSMSVLISASVMSPLLAIFFYRAHELVDMGIPKIDFKSLARSIFARFN